MGSFIIQRIVWSVPVHIGPSHQLEMIALSTDSAMTCEVITVALPFFSSFFFSPSSLFRDI